MWHTHKSNALSGSGSPGVIVFCSQWTPAKHIPACQYFCNYTYLPLSAVTWLCPGEWSGAYMSLCVYTHNEV